MTATWVCSILIAGTHASWLLPTRPGYFAADPTKACIARGVRFAIGARRNRPLMAAAHAPPSAFIRGVPSAPKPGTVDAMLDREFNTLDALVRTLGEEFFTVSAAEIPALVAAEHGRYAGRPVRDVVPMLVERAVREHLRVRAPRQRRSAGATVRPVRMNGTSRPTSTSPAR